MGLGGHFVSTPQSISLCLLMSGSSLTLRHWAVGRADQRALATTPLVPSFRTVSVRIPRPRLIRGARGHTLVRSEASAPPTTLASTGAMGSMPRVAVVTTLGCPYCKKAKVALRDAGVPFEELELSEQLEVLTRIKQLTGQATVPQVFVGGKLIGGASELLPQLADGSLKQQLAAQGAGDPLPPAVRQALKESGAAAQAAGAGSSISAGSEEEELAERMLKAGPARDASPDRSFTLQAATDWVASSCGLPPEAALQQLARLQAAQLLTVVLPAEPSSGSTGGFLSGLLGRGKANQLQQQQQGCGDVAISRELLTSQPGVRVKLVAEAQVQGQLGRPLNTHFAWLGPARPAAEVSEGLRRGLLRLYDSHLSPGGKKLDYAALRADPAWRRFVDATAELQKVDLSSLSRDERLAFFINVYNALVVHATVAIGPATDSLSRSKWYRGIQYQIGGYDFSSDDIEHGVLRGNKPSPAALLALLGRPQWAARTFGEGDPRAALAIQPMDPRIHFALNCGANSCPAIKVYDPHNLEFGLASAASAFCASEVEVFPERSELRLSMILKWYGGDFGSKRDLLQFLLKYLPAERKEKLERMLAAAKDVDRDIKFSFRPYDWGVNSK